MTDKTEGKVVATKRERIPWGTYGAAVLAVPAILTALHGMRLDENPALSLVWCLGGVTAIARFGGFFSAALAILSAVLCFGLSSPLGLGSNPPGLIETASFVVVAVFSAAFVDRLRKREHRESAMPHRLKGYLNEQRQPDQGFDLLRAAVESANDAILITTPDLDSPGPVIEYVNPVFTQMTGYTAAEVLGKSPRLLQGPKTDREVLQQLRRDLSTKQSFHGETVNYRKDGTEYFVEWHIAALRDLTGRVTHWVAIQRDVSERKQAERRREHLLEAERAARSDAERVGRMKDEFLATLSHELRTPLNAILGWSHLLQSEHATKQDFSVGIETIERNARAQSQLIEDLLDMSSIISGKVRLNVQRYELKGVMQAALDAVRPSVEAKRLTVVVDPGAFIHTLSGDPDRLQQVFWNLLNNAVKFTPPGGKITLSEHTAGDHVAVSIADSGQGIEPDFLPYVFDRFRQADASTTRHQGGLGLGLSIVRSLVEMHGGTVGAESAGRGRGSTFTVSLPTLAAGRPSRGQGARSEGGVDSAASKRQSHELRRLRILVVEDDPDSREVLKRSLETYGATVITASSAKVGLELLKREQPNILVSDIGMPEVDGFELIRCVRALPAEQGGRVPAIAVTAYTRPDDRRQTLMAGYQTYMAKPVEPMRLLQACVDLTGASPDA